MTNESFQIRPMRREDVGAIALEWAAREGWNPGLDDAEAFYAADPEGFLLGELDGEPAGCISAVAYDDQFGFLGLYIVRPDLRGRGYGQRLWRTGLERLGRRNIGLDGVLARHEDYERSGFALAYRNIRFRLRAQRKMRAVVTASPRRVAPAAALPFETLAGYDRHFFPGSRENFLRRWIAQPHGTALAMLNAEERIIGYGAIRDCREGHKIGPLFADDANVAEVLFHALISHAPDPDPVYLDVPEVNPAALELVYRHGMERVFETARMYSGRHPVLPMEKIYGVTTFELG